MQNMSFMLTTPQVRTRSKDVTRRLGWLNLKPGQQVMACEKCQGLGKGGNIVRIDVIECVSNRTERLDSITQEEVVREGFPQMCPADFVVMFCEHNKCFPWSMVQRVEFKYVYLPGYVAGLYAEGREL